MDVLPRITRQLVDQFREMPPVQRVASIALLVVVCSGFSWLVFFNHRTELQPVSFGKSFENEELASAEQALVAAGLTGFRRDGQRLLVPVKDLPRYNAALLEFNALPADLGSQMIKHYETLGPFSTDRQRLQMKEALLLQELRRMIKAVPDIDAARVVIATPERRSGWNQKTRPTANVSVKPRPGREISVNLANSLRHVVASVVPDLLPADVTIFDVTRGQAFTGEPTDSSIDARQRQQTTEISHDYEERLQKALSHIPNVGVVVQIAHVERRPSFIRSAALQSHEGQARVINRPVSIDDVDAHSTGFRGATENQPEMSTIDAESKTGPATQPRQNIRVSISIPRDYLRDVARRMRNSSASPRQMDLESIEQDVTAKVERIVTGLIPTDSSRQSISVTCVDRLDTEQSNEVLSSSSWKPVSPLQKWRGPLIIAAITSLAGIWILRRATRPTSSLTEWSNVDEHEPISEISDSVHETITPMTVSKRDHIVILRDEIRSLVESDPAATAALLGTWLSEASE